jgi:hypothetical protein
MKKYEITLIINPNGLHIEKPLGTFSDINMLAKLLELVETFQSLGLNIEGDKESQLCYWVNSNTGGGIFYIHTKEAK